MMTPEELLQNYRLLDAAYGTLETSERIRGELVELRRDQLNLRRKSIWDRLLVILITLTTGVPVLLGILPERVLAPRSVWVAIFAGLVLCYAAMAIYNWARDTAEEREITSKVETMPYQKSEDDPVFLEMQLTTMLTRLSLAGEILASDPPDPMKVEFERAVRSWMERVKKAADRIEAMYKMHRIGEERYRRMRSWIDQALGAFDSGQES